jgi:apolipoprotein D and lipocalin family protein
VKNVRRAFAISSFVLLALLGGTAMANDPIPTANHVELERFMGDWYVIANIPTWFERDAWNAVESYTLEADGRIATTFTFRRGGPDGKPVEYRPTGFVQGDASNAVWAMQFLWPFKSEYLIAYVDPDYRETIVARNKRDYVWIMARDPQLSDADYERLVKRVEALGYDTRKLQRVPQRDGAPEKVSR